jgi:hypothetical protein
VGRTAWIDERLDDLANRDWFDVSMPRELRAEIGGLR